jgi:MOSC domain-containing protein YiiM
VTHSTPDGSVLSVNVGAIRPTAAKGGTTGIDKRPVDQPVFVSTPGHGLSGLSGDAICDVDNHGGPEQAVYAYAREDLDRWQGELGRSLHSGVFGENVTTVGMDVTGAEVGEQWRIGPELLLQVTTPRIPCRTFALWLDQEGWVRTFTERAVPGAYFTVLNPGHVADGDTITVVRKPGHGVTMGLVFRALTLESELLPRLLDADDLPESLRTRVSARLD